MESKKIGIITLEEPNSIQAEMHRSIRTNLEYSSIDKEIKIINITSTIANEAKTTTSCNLAVTLANSNKSVLLIDLDLRGSSCHRMFNIKNDLGITDMLVDFTKNGEAIDLNKYLKKIVHPNIANSLFVITTGTNVINPTEILSSQKIKELLQFLRNHFDRIVIDSSPSGIITDGVVTSKLADGTIFIIESNHTKIEPVQKTIAQLKNLNINILGVILTKVNYKSKQYGYYNYGYGNNESKQDKIKIHIE